jgi:hypothetical protein
MEVEEGEVKKWEEETKAKKYNEKGKGETRRLKRIGR